MTGFSKATRELVFLRAGGRCERCGWIEEAAQYHHRRPRGMGGSRAVEVLLDEYGYVTQLKEGA